MQHQKTVDVLERFTYGIYLLTTSNRTRRNVMVASWVSQVSWDPLRVMVAIRKGRYSYELILEGRCFALHPIGESGYPDLTRLKSISPEERLGLFRWRVGRSGAPILLDTLGFLDCSLFEVVDAGDHSLFLGDVVDGELFSTNSPLTTREYGSTYLGRR